MLIDFIVKELQIFYKNFHENFSKTFCPVIST